MGCGREAPEDRIQGNAGGAAREIPVLHQGPVGQTAQGRVRKSHDISGIRRRGVRGEIPLMRRPLPLTPAPWLTANS